MPSKDRDDILKLRPVKFYSKTEKTSHLGFIAEECHRINPIFTWTREGEIEGIDQLQMLAALISLVQNQDKRITELERLLNDN